jgi:hypothetical protein
MMGLLGFPEFRALDKEVLLAVVMAGSYLVILGLVAIQDHRALGPVAVAVGVVLMLRAVHLVEQEEVGDVAVQVVLQGLAIQGLTLILIVIHVFRLHLEEVTQLVLVTPELL